MTYEELLSLLRQWYEAYSAEAYNAALEELNVITEKVLGV